MLIKIITLGCKVNQYESQALKEAFLKQGCKIASGKADLYLINTCTVTSQADRKSRYAIMQARRDNPQAKIAVCGCLAQLNKQELEKLKVDYIFEHLDKPSIVSRILYNSREVRDIWDLEVSKAPQHKAFIKVQDGCNQFCSFCKIPYLRGPIKSRNIEQTIKEVERVSSNYREVILCGVNLALYGRDLGSKVNLELLVKKILDIPSLGRLRLSSLEAIGITDGLLECFKHPKLCPHLHIPFQTADDKVLKDMNRKVTVGLYKDIINKVRTIKPDIALSCDLIVGFPSETQENFSNTVKFLEEVRPMRIHLFTFSPRENTKLSQVKLTNQQEVKKRYKVISKLADQLALSYSQSFLGKDLIMLADGHSGQYTSGYSENYLRVWLKQVKPLGELYKVKLKSISSQKNIVV